MLFSVYLITWITLIEIVCGSPFLWIKELRVIDPEASENATEIIRSHGYDVQEHFVETEDGYILCLIRMRNPNVSFTGKTRVVFMQHGLLDSAHTWINNLRNESLGFILADAGFDVWLGNSRGSTYSRRHKTLSPEDLSYWNFSWDHMAKFDLPASLNYVLCETGSSQIGYVGHSQGTQIAFAQFDSDIELQSRISLFVALAPVAYLGHVLSPVRLIAPFSHTLEKAWDILNHGEFFPSSPLFRSLAFLLCPKERLPHLCTNVIYLFAGYDPGNTNLTRVPVYVAHTPAGTSVQNIVHYFQSMQSDRFQQFDYGKQKNLAIYGQESPPEYEMSRITVPTALYYGGRDWLAVPKDVHRISERIKQAVIAQVCFEHFNHLDFVWGLDAGYVLYPSVVDLLSKH